MNELSGGTHMPEIRQDPTTKEWVIIASERRGRPFEVTRQQAKLEEPAFVSSCPFCQGNESMTPPVVLAYTDQKSGAWQVRAFPNKFPALMPNETTLRKEEENFFLSMGGAGAHEVVVETPLHNKPLALMNDGEVSSILRAYHERYNALSRLPFVKLVLIFKNHGRAAGTSLKHPHSQIVATPIVPRHLRMQYEVAIRYYDDSGRCLYADIVHNELRTGKRILMETERFVVFHPFATWIVPKIHNACFGNASSEELQDLARILRTILLKIYRGLNNPDFNYIIDTAPVGDENKDYYIWHMRIIPRLSMIAGFEIGSGIYINSTFPEETAPFIRDLKI
jgi:UDPglucose--hexose-1-phosphate uridylyltransferase